MFSIGEFARLGQVSVKMLRHYDSIGLLRPASVEPVTGYRYYTAAQLPVIGRIIALRDLGFGLGEIAMLAGREPCPADHEIVRAYDARERQLRDSIAADQARLRRLKASRTALIGGAQAEVLVRVVPRQTVATSPSRDFAALERHVAARGARASGPPMTLIGEQVAAAVPLQRSLPGKSGIPDEAGRPGELSPPHRDGRARDNGLATEHGVAVRTLPAVPQMACVLYRGGYNGLPAQWQALLAWVHDIGAEPGHDLREVYLNFAAEDDLALRADYLADSPGDFVTELQVPIDQ